jgi:hypothetical protein
LAKAEKGAKEIWRGSLLEKVISKIKNKIGE